MFLVLFSMVLWGFRSPSSKNQLKEALDCQLKIFQYFSKLPVSQQNDKHHVKEYETPWLHFVWVTLSYGGKQWRGEGKEGHPETVH